MRESSVTEGEKMRSYGLCWPALASKKRPCFSPHLLYLLISVFLSEIPWIDWQKKVGGNRRQTEEEVKHAVPSEGMKALFIFTFNRIWASFIWDTSRQAALPVFIIAFMYGEFQLYFSRSLWIESAWLIK